MSLIAINLKNFFSFNSILKNIVLLILTISTVAGGTNGGPLFSVPASDIKITIDGKLEEAEWNNAALISVFSVVGENRIAQENTKVMVKYDADNLYFGFYFSEYALEPSSNQLKSFKAALQGKQQPIWRDDSCEMRFIPPWRNDNQFFYLGFSAAGGTFVNRPIDIKPALESKIKLKTWHGRGFWSAELAVPLSALNNGKKVSPLGSWKINFVRFEQRIPEMSSWCVLEKGMHTKLQRHGTMVLTGKNTPSVRMGAFNKIESLMSVPVTLTGVEWQGDWQSVIDDGRKGRESGRIKSPTQFNVTVPLLKDGIGGFAFSIGNFFRSPVYSFTSDSQTLNMSLTGKAQLKFNGKALSGDSFQCFPANGMNKIELVLPAGSEARLNVGTANGLPDKWRSSSSEAVAVKDNDEIVFHNKSGGEAVFSCSFLANGSIVTPSGVEDKTFNLTAGGSYLLEWNILRTRGWDFEQPLKNPKLHLYVPKQIDFMGVSSRAKYPEGLKILKWPKEFNAYTISKLKTISIKGRSYTHYLVSRVNNALIDKAFNKHHRHHQVTRDTAKMFFRGKENAAGNEDCIYYHLEANNGELGELIRMLPVKIFSRLDGRYNPEISVSLLAYQLDDIAETNLTDPFYDTLSACGINELIYDTRFAPPKRFKYLALICFELVDWRNTYPKLYKFFAKHPDSRMIDSLGRKVNTLSMSYILEHPELHADLQQVFDDQKHNNPGMTTIFYDFEQNPFTGINTGDYADAALKRFAAYSNIQEKLTPKLIKGKYAEQWTDFRGHELGEFTKLIYPMLKKSGFELTFYSDYDSPKAINMYTLNWKYLANRIDRAYMGYGRNVKLIDRTLKTLKGTPAVFGLLTSPHSRDYELALILRRIIDCKGGVLCWYESGFGALEAMELANATRFYSDHKKFFAVGKRVDNLMEVSGLLPDNVICFELDGEFLLLLLNEGGAKENAMIFPACSDARLKEYFSGAEYDAKQAISISIAPRSAVAFRGKIGPRVLRTEHQQNGESESVNLLKNPSFEEVGKSEQALVNWDNKPYRECVRSKLRASSGEYSAMLEGDGKNNIAIIQDIPLEKIKAANYQLELSLDYFVESHRKGLIYLAYMIVSTRDEQGKHKSMYPPPRRFSGSADVTGTWTRIRHRFDLSGYKNITAVKFMVLGWSYQKDAFDGRFFVDNIILSKSKESSK